MVLILAVRLPEICKFIVKLEAGPERVAVRQGGHVCFRHFRMLEPTVIFVVSVRPSACITASSTGRFSFSPVKIHILDFTKIS